MSPQKDPLSYENKLFALFIGPSLVLGSVAGSRVFVDSLAMNIFVFKVPKVE